MLIGCTDHANEIWIATEKVPVYDRPDGSLLFFLKPTDVCEPGMDMAGKVDMYTKVKCNSGNGWVIGEKFKRLMKSSQR